MEDEWRELLTGILRYGQERGEFETAFLDGFAHGSPRSWTRSFVRS